MQDFDIEYGRMIGYYGKAETVIVPGEARVITNGAFYHRSGIRQIVLSSGVQEIECGAFNGCADLESLYIPASVREIEPHPVGGCPRFRAFEVSEDNIYFKAIDGILYNKEGTVLLACPTGRQGGVVVPDGVKVIGPRAFAGCKGVLQISLPPDLQEIGNSAFTDSGLTSVRIPAGVMRIAPLAFKRCGSLERFRVDARNPVYGSQDGLLYLKKERSLLWCPEGRRGEAVVADGTRVIGENAFNHCEKLTAVRLPEGLRRIKWGAFTDCGSLTSMTIPASVQEVGDYPFDGSVRLREIINYGRPLFSHKGPKGMEVVTVERGFLPGEDLAALDPETKLMMVSVYLSGREQYSSEEQAVYDAYIRRQNGRLLRIFIEKRRIEQVRALLEGALVTPVSIEKALDTAADLPEVLAMLLDYQNRHTDRKKGRIDRLLRGLE